VGGVLDARQCDPGFVRHRAQCLDVSSFAPKQHASLMMSATLRTRARVLSRAEESVVVVAASPVSRLSRSRRAMGVESRAWVEGVKREASWAVALQASSRYHVRCFCDSVAAAGTRYRVGGSAVAVEK
jgi:hypothetical protein